MTQPVFGPLTSVNIAQTAAFLHPWEMDPWGRLRPPLSVEALQMSAELAAACHSLNIRPWLRAGWREVTVQVDGELTALENAEGSLSAKWQRQLVRSKMRGYNPVSQIAGALRERESSATGKAVVMIRPAEDGRYVVAVCFMGTGTRFYDWFSNFRMSAPDGIHKGFGQITAQFEENEGCIAFPKTAAELNLEKLTLAHILKEMKSPKSRFLLWLSGHSQGGAVMQVYAHRKIVEEGVHPLNVVGYGFASPSVMTGRAVSQPEAYPLYHVHNSDDLVPRCGAALHLGVCLTCQADEALRRSCYGWPRDEAAVRARIAVRPVVRQMTDNANCIVQARAMLAVLGSRSAAEIAEVLGLGDGLPIGKLLEVADMKAALDRVNRRLEAAYQSVAGEALPAERVEEAAALMRQIIAQTGLKPFMGALFQLLRYPHRISARSAGEFLTPYAWIAANAADRLIPSIWRAGLPPERLYIPPAEGRSSRE